MSIATYRCRLCSEQKKTANHWYIVRKGAGAVTFMTWEAAEQVGLLDDPETEWICGQLHSHKTLDEFFAAAMPCKSVGILEAEGCRLIEPEEDRDSHEANDIAWGGEVGCEIGPPPSEPSSSAEVDPRQREFEFFHESSETVKK
jgi:hypothetical protein